MTAARALPGLIGAALMIAIVAWIGPREIAIRTIDLGWVLIALVGGGFIKHALRAMGWRLALRAEGVRVPALTLAQARVASQSVAFVASMGSAVGDPVKAWLIRRHARVRDTLAPTMVEALVYWFTSLILTLLTIAAAAYLFKPAWAASALLGFGLLAAALSWLMWTKRPVLGPAARFWERRRPNGRMAGWLRQAAETEGRVRSFRVRHPWTTPAILLIALTAQAVTTAEVALVLWRLGEWPGWIGALWVDGFARASKAVSFYIPGRFGADEAATAGALAALGAPAAAGVSLALAKRFQTMIWAALGLAWLRFDGPTEDSSSPGIPISEELQSCKP